MARNSNATGPETLNERSIGGILVHVFSLFLGFFGAGIVYLLSRHSFTRENARHALNWHLSVFVLAILGFVSFLLGADDVSVAGESVEFASILPAPVDTVFAMTGWLLLFIAVIGAVLTLIFAIIATAKAIFGSAWKYPGSFGLI